MTVRLIHGIREMKPESHMRPLGKLLARKSIPYSHVSYGPVWIPVTNQKAVNALIEEVEPGDDLVGFSNGCWAIHQYLELGHRARNVFLISPALNVNAEFPNCHRATVYHSSGDWPTRLAKTWRRTTRVLPWRWQNPHGWGQMGRKGYQGDDSKVLNIDLGSAVGHNWYDYPETVRMIANDIQLAVT